MRVCDVYMMCAFSAILQACGFIDLSINKVLFIYYIYKDIYLLNKTTHFKKRFYNLTRGLKQQILFVISSLCKFAMVDQL